MFRSSCHTVQATQTRDTVSESVANVNMSNLNSTATSSSSESTATSASATSSNGASNSTCQSSTNDLIQCTICFRDYDDQNHIPRVCLCGHSLCTACAKAIAGRHAGESVQCPVCRALTPTANLPINYSLLAMVPRATLPQDLIQIFVKLIGGKTITISIQPSATVAILKQKIQDKEGIKVGEMRLNHCGKQLEDGFKLSDYKIEAESNVYVLFRLLGGKD